MTDLLIKTILVDDEPRGITALQKLLEQNCPEVKVVASCTDCMEARQTINRLKPDLVFLDISMPGMNGFELLNEVNHNLFETVFITAHSNYAVNAFQYNAADYLLKPVAENLLIDAVSKVSKKIHLNLMEISTEMQALELQKTESPNGMKLCVPSLKGFSVIDVADVLYCEAASSYTTFHLANGSPIISSKPIIDYELLLKSNGFFRVHKSFLINLRHVKEYLREDGGCVIMSNNKCVGVSRRKKELFMARIKNFFKF